MVHSCNCDTSTTNFNEGVFCLKGQELLCYLPTPPLGQDMTQGQFFNRFEFRVVLLLDKLPHQGWRTQSVLLFTHSWRENNWIHTFPKGISAMWNAISLAQDLNSFPTTITITPRALPSRTVISMGSKNWQKDGFKQCKRMATTLNTRLLLL